jgi:hypothetical protein
MFRVLFSVTKCFSFPAKKKGTRKLEILHSFCHDTKLLNLFDCTEYVFEEAESGGRGAEATTLGRAGASPILQLSC